MKICSECNCCLEKWIGPFFHGFVCSKTFEDIVNELDPPCLKKENNNE
jgi:hypothetical protein